MLGWWIIIKDPTLGKDKDPKAGRLADWEVGINGDKWLKDLEKAGKAVLVKSNCGYPNLYRALAGDVLPPLLDNGPPSFPGLGFFEEFCYIPAGWTRRLSFDWKAIAACLSDQADQELLIEVWDLS
ncbi:MAG: hypothetical protein LBD04_07220 [Synergistaceae bacterium]|jgi:hypothetical protein|nr:hypothetical protein [Synergistaceae bacterium]